MSVDASSLVIRVQSEGVASATEALNKLAAAGDKAEKSAAKLSSSNKGAEASAKKQEALWYDLVDKASKFYERQFNAQQKALERQNKAAEMAMLREAQSMDKAFDKRLSDEQSSYAKLQAQADKFYAEQQRKDAASYAKLQSDAEKFYANKIKDAEKALAAETTALAKAEAVRKAEADRAYASMQAEANRINKLRDQQIAQAESSAKRTALLNAQFSTASSGSRLSTVRQAVAYGAQGGDVEAMYGSEVAAKANATGIAQLSAEHRRLQEEANRSRLALNGHNQEMENAHALVRGLSGSLGALWLTYGNIIPLIAGAAIGASIKEAVSGFAAVQYQMTFMKALTEDTTNSVKSLTEEMHKVAGELGIDPESASKGLRALAQAGLDTTKALETLPAAFKLATVGELPLESAALAGISVMNAYGKSVRDFENIGDIMAKAGAMSAASVSSMTESFKYSAGTAEQYGVSLEKLATVMTMLGKRSITGSSAGVAANNLITEVYSPSSQKAIQAQAALGVKAYANGVRKSLEDVIQDIKEGLKKYDTESQGILLEAMFGKKGGKAFYAIAQQTKDQFKEMEGDLEKSAGFTANVYRQSLETITGQLSLTKSAISNMFSTIGEESEGPVKSLLQSVRLFANDPAVKDAFTGMAQSIKTLLTVVLPTAGALGGIWAAFKLGTIAVAGLTSVFARLAAINLVNYFAQALASVTLFVEGVVTMNAALLLSNPIFLTIAGVVAALGAAYLVLHKNKESALSLHETEMKNSKEVQENLQKEVDLLDKKLKLAKQGVRADDEAAALRKMGVSDDIARLQQEILEREEKARSLGGDAALTTQKLPGPIQRKVDSYKSEIDARKQAIEEKRKDYAIEEAIEKRRKEHLEELRLVRVGQDLEDEGQGKGPLEEGTKKFDPKGELESKKLINAYKQEMLELQKLGATYDAKTQAMLEFYRTGSKVAADSQQAIVEVNRLQHKYLSDDMYQKALTQAKIVDEAKFRNEKAKTFVDLTGNMEKIIDGEDAFQQAAKDSGTVKLGYYARQVEAAKQMLGWSDKEIAKAREMAAVADEVKRAEEARTKLSSAADSSNARAGEARAEIDSMLMFGTKTKATALELAKLAIEKARLSSAGDQAIKDNLLEAAATETLEAAYNDLLKNKIALNAELEKSQADSLDLFGQSEVERVRIAADAERKIADLKMANAQSGFDSKALSGTATFQDVSDINAANAAYTKTLDTIDQISRVKIDNILTKEAVDRWRELGNVVEDGLTKAFGKAGAAAGRMFNLFANGQARDMQATKQVAALKERESKDGISRATEISDIQKDAATARIGEYAGMADAAQGFFEEGSRGYEAMAKASQVLHAAEVALSLIKGVNAILTQGEGDPYSAFARMAAMTAMVAALGVAVGGGGSGGGMSSADKQATQGTGSVLGSPTVISGTKVELTGEKSNSIAHSLSILEKNSGLGLVIQTDMLDAMRRLSDNIDSLAVLVVQNSGLTGVTAPDSKSFSGKGIGALGAIGGGVGGAMLGTYLGMGMAAIGGPLGLAIGAALGSILGHGFVGKALSSVFGGSTSVTDTGLTVGKASVGQIAASGINASQYTNTKTDGGWFRSDKNNKSLSSLGTETNDQFSKVILSMADTLKAASVALGIGGDAFNAKLQSFVVDIGEISLKGMTGEQIQTALQNVFSKLSDQMAAFAFSDLQQYQKIGEGLMETVTRVANDLLQVNDVFAVLSKTIPKGVAAIATSEQLISKFGTVDDLTKGVKDYMNAIYTDQEKLAPVIKSVSAAMSSLGYAGVTTKEQFKQVVDGIDITTDTGATLFKTLMNIAPAFGQVADAAETANQTLVDGFQSTIDKMKDFSNSIKSFRDGLILGNLSTLTPEQKLAAAASQYQTTLQKAMSGDENAQGKLTDVAQSYLEAGRTLFASSDAYTKIFDRVQSEMSGVSDWADNQVSDAQKQIDQLQGLNNTSLDILGALTGISDTLNAVAPVTANAPASQAGADVVVTAVTGLKMAIEELKKTVAEAGNNTVGAVYDSSIASAEKLAASIDDSLQSTSKSNQYKIVER